VELSRAAAATRTRIIWGERSPRQRENGVEQRMPPTTTARCQKRNRSGHGLGGRRVHQAKIWCSSLEYATFSLIAKKHGVTLGALIRESAMAAIMGMRCPYTTPLSDDEAP
jgi:hypothetical protein